jgi:Uma2 family endonuclease
MGMPAPQTEWTAEMVRALPDDGKRHEVVDGELFVSPAPRLAHQAVVGRLFALLDAYVRQHKLGWVFMSPADIEFSPTTLVQPDVFVVPDTGAGRPSVWGEITTLSLVAEVISRPTARLDRTVKRPEYQRQRIPVCWIVDADAQLFELWEPGDERPAIATTTLRWHPRQGIPPLEVNLPQFFADALN